VWQADAVPSAPAGACRPFDRALALRRLADEQFDVLVVGGGVTGTGVALDAAARGLRTALVERHDFASGTSSKSSKMVHGGLRYLQHGDFRLVAEALRERQRLLRNAPHLVSPLPFLIPLFGRHGTVSAGVARAYASALWIYDVAGGWRIGHRHRRIDRSQVLAHLPTLRTDRLVAGFLYYDAQADDARLTLALARTAACDFGAAVANYAEVVGFADATGQPIPGSDPSAGRAPGGGSPRPVAGAVVRLRGPGEDAEVTVRASVVVNATGVWADELRVLDEGPHARTTRPAKGVHVTVPGDRLPADIAAVMPVPGDRRSVFVVPWPDGADTYVGTTDTDWSGDLDHPDATADDVDYLLGAVNAASTADLDRRDVTGVWAGLRPLVAAGGASASARTADLSRRHRVLVSPSGVVTVTGGKLTTYRLMAQDTVDAVVRLLGPAAPPAARRCPTRRLALRGAPGTAPPPEDEEPEPALAGARSQPVQTRTGAQTLASTQTLPAWGRDGRARTDGVGDGGTAGADQWLRARYGSEHAAVRALADGRPELLEPIVPGLPYRRVEVLWAARHEMALTVADIVHRRTRAAIRRARATAEAVTVVADLLAEATGRPVAELRAEASGVAAELEAELARAGVPQPSPAPGTRAEAP
jgi:glycerol-3-phosphate dehydrogenase